MGSPASPRMALTLFWRTFTLLALLLTGSILAWQFTFRALDAEPRALETAHQLAGLVNLSRVALAQSDPINRVGVIKSLTHNEDVRVEVAEATDRWLPYDTSVFAQRLVQALRTRLGDDTIVARSLNGDDGLWVRFDIGRDKFWLRTNPNPLSVAMPGNAWWLLIALFGTVLGSVMIARLINQPLRELSIAAGRIREGEYDSRLDEGTLTSEIREVNMGFNRMARELAKVEEDRNIMLAGISHDLRTPLARLRLELEMSVTDEQARQYMAMDIDQLDGIIGKFMDYARPTELRLKSVPLYAVLEREAIAFRRPEQISIQLHVAPELHVWADETELSRVFLNLFENARRYGHKPDAPAKVVVQAKVSHGDVLLSVRDFGPGVPDDKLARLTTPFFRGDTARTAATGAGLGLAIVERSLQRMNAGMSFANAPDGGLVITLRLRRST